MGERKRKREYDYVVARTILFAPPAKAEKVPHIEAQVLTPFRADYSNLGRNQGSGPGGKREKGMSQKTPWRTVAAQKLQSETGIAVPENTLLRVGRFENTAVNPEGQSFLTLSHVFMTELAEHPERVVFDSGQTGMLWLNVVDGEVQQFFLDEFGKKVMEVTLAFNTLKMINVALKLRKSLRSQN